VQGSLDRWLAPARRRSSKKTAERAWERGRAIPLDDAVAHALREVGAFRAAGAAITSREREMVELVSLGLTNRQMAGRLALSVRTVDSHLERIRSKLGCSNRVQIAAWFAQNK
jgi:non-specific serine/threonine protein kinase